MAGLSFACPLVLSRSLSGFFAVGHSCPWNGNCRPPFRGQYRRRTEPLHSPIQYTSSASCQMASERTSAPTSSTACDGPAGELRIFKVEQSHVGMRFDRVLTDTFGVQSRTYFQALIEDGLVRVNGDLLRSKSRKATYADLVEVEFVTPARDLPLQAEDIPLDVLFEDEHFVVVNKPAGMVVHPAPGNWHGTLVHALAFRYEDHLGLGGIRPGVVHRLDKGTSGAIVCARTADAHRALSTMFAMRQVEKTYVAVTVGNPAGEGCTSTVISSPIGRSRADRTRMTVVEEEFGGKSARSIVRVLASDDRRLLHIVEVGLETGRTHQIRVHMQQARAPILGDDLYGAVDVNHRFRAAAPRPLLHAQSLKFSHPFSSEELEIRAPFPSGMMSLVEKVYPSVHQDRPMW